MELIFVYNANSGFLNSIKDLLHKSVSPKTYDCNLCFLTYSGISQKEEWKTFINKFPLKAVFLHKDEFTKQYPKYAMITYPIVFKKEKRILKEFISAEEINKLSGLEDLKQLVQNKISEL